MSTEIIYNTYDNEASIVHDDIVNDKVLKVVTAPFGNSDTKDVLEYPLAENLLEVQSYGFSQFIKVSFLVRKAEVILHIDDEDIVVAEAENIEMNHWHRLEGFFTMDELKKVDFNSATLRLRITKAFNDPEVYIYRPCLTKGDTIPDWFPSLEEIMGDITESQSLISADRRLENLASDLTEIEQNEVKTKLNIKDGGQLKKIGDGYGLQDQIDNPDNYGTLGYGAVNFTYSDDEGDYGATGLDSYAEGYKTIASGQSSHAEGEYTTASGEISHTEGYGSTASGNWSHAEGYDATASGEVSHAEGAETEASGRVSHAEGVETIASGNASHAEGEATAASGIASHAEGYETEASGNASHAEGQGPTASGQASHAEGYETIASGDATHAEGYKATASGYASHAEGSNTTASGEVSHAEGSYTTAGSYAENARGVYNEIITPISPTYFNANDVIESVGVGTGTSARKNALTRWKNGAFKWLLQPLTNITNAVLGFHASDENGRLNYHDGTEWKKYLIEGEEGSGGGGASAYTDLTDAATVDLPTINTPLASALAGKEDAFTKNTAFNKNFGTGSNDVAEGNHTHSELHTHSNKSTLDTITADDLVDYFEAHQKTVTGVSFTGDVNKTLTITRLDGTILTASFVDKEGDGGGVTDGVLNTLEFNTTTGVLTATVLNGTTEVPIDVIFDGRYSLITHTHQLSDINGLQEALDSKVDKVVGKELSDNNFSTQEKNKLASLENFDDSAIQSELDTKVDKVVGKGLSDENYTLAEKDKLAGLENFDDSVIQSELANKVDKVVGKGLSDENYTLAEKDKLAGLENFDDSAIQSELDTKADTTYVNTQLDTKVDKVIGKGLSDENYTLAEKDKLAGLENFDDSTIQAELDTKVDKVVGKGLSDENYTLAEKDKLGGIEDEATANSTDAQLRDRATHTGVQPIASVDGLQDALDEKVDDTDSRLTNSREWTASVVTQPEAEVGTSTTARKWTSQRVRQAILGWWNNSIFKTKLDGIEDGATANATDAQLRDRATHTGAQPISSVTNLQSSLDSKVDKQAGMGLSSNDFTTAEKQKLAGLEEPNYRGTFATETSIQDLTDPKPGNYALLDLGVGEDVVPYFYDVTDGKWVPGGGSTELTPAQLKSLYESNPDTNAFTDTEKTKLAGIATEATKNQTDTYLTNRANHTGSQDISTITGLSGALDSKVDKVAGKELSDNNYTNAEKTKLVGIAPEATKNDTDANLLDRANHTGSQAMSTITGLSGALDSKVSMSGDDDIDGKKTFKIVPASAEDAVLGTDLIRKSQWDAYNTQVTAEITGHLAARENHSNKKTSIETYKTSNTFYPSIKAVYDWAIGKFGELKKIGVGYGLQHQIDNPTYYGTLGENAVNLSLSEKGGNFGATGKASLAEGSATTASGDGSHAEGISTTASGDGSHAEGRNTIAGSFAENARGAYNEEITPISATAFDPTDVIESVGIGNPTTRKNALTRWKNGAFKWLLQPLTNITNAVLGFHAADEDGRLNYHDGTDWNKYLLEGEGGELKKIGDGYGLQHQIDNPTYYGTLGNNAVNLSFSEYEGDSGATGINSHAEGYLTTASGDYGSHAEGSVTIASGGGSHAEGSMTEASGGSSHAEGSNTKAIGSASHAEGNYTEASANNSHAEGTNTKATGEGSHAEGYYSIASNYYSHAEGKNTTASGQNSHAEGSGTQASGSSSHAEGSNTKAIGSASHAEGSETQASGSSSHAEGLWTRASSYAENARGTYNEIITPNSATTFNANDVIESVGVGSNIERKNALTRWKNGAFKWLLQPLTNITNAVIGFHAADQNGRLNYHNGTEWKKYLIEGEEGSGGGGASDYVDLTDAATADLPTINTPLASALAGKEDAFTKNTAFNKDFGTVLGTVAQGNDSRFHTHSNKAVLDGITSTIVTEWNDVADAYASDKLMTSGFENAQYSSTVSSNPSVLVRNTDKSVGLIPLDDIFDTTLQLLIDDSILDHPDGYLELDFTGTNYIQWAFPANGFIEVNKDSFNIVADITTLAGGAGALILNAVGNIFSDKNPSPKGIQYENDYSGTYTNRSLVDKGYVDKAISDIPSTNNNNKWFIGSKANPLNTPSIEIDTQGLMQGHEIVITYERAGQVGLPLIVSSRPNVKIELYSIDDSVNFESGAMNRIYLHLTEAIEDDTYQFDITVGKINTYANI